jgi:hypothetical protein
MGKLSVFTGDAFYSEFYKMLGQTMASYQAFYSAYPFFSIGLVPSRDREGPVDVVGETHNGRIGVGIIPFGAMYVLDLDHSDSYRYVGGPDWGVGLDYVLAFQPCFSPSCYLAACSFALCDARYAHEETALYLTTDETVAGEVLLRCTQAPEGLRLVVNGVEYLAKQLHHDANLSLLTISL